MSTNSVRDQMGHPVCYRNSERRRTRCTSNTAWSTTGSSGCPRGTRRRRKSHRLQSLLWPRLKFGRLYDFSFFFNLATLKAMFSPRNAFSFYIHKDDERIGRHHDYGGEVGYGNHGIDIKCPWSFFIVMQDEKILVFCSIWHITHKCQNNCTFITGLIIFWLCPRQTMLCGAFLLAPCSAPE